MFEQLNLREWPFRPSADEHYAAIWAGRTRTKIQLTRLLSKMKIIPKSNLHIFWANFGMGKTHTLFHLKYRAQKNDGQIIPIYTVMPKSSSGFIELYREIAQAFLSIEMRDYLGRQLVELGQTCRGSSVALHPMFSKSPGVVKALLAIRSGDIEATTNAMQWLIGQPGLSSRVLSAIGVSYRIKTPEDAINALSTLINLATYTGKKQKQLLLMIDEYQRIGELKSKVMNQVNSCLHTIFNQHPVGLQLMLTFSFGKKENVEFLLSPELKSRADLQPITLDLLSHEEGVIFLEELLDHFHIQKDTNNLLFPFTDDAVHFMLETIEKKKTLTPRRIMSYANHVLSEFMIDSDGSSEVISRSYIENILTSGELGDLDIDLDSN